MQESIPIAAMELSHTTILTLIWLLNAILYSLVLYILIRFLPAAYDSKAHLEQRIALLEHHLSILESRPSTASSVCEKGPLITSSRDEEQIRETAQEIGVLKSMLDHNRVLRTVLFFGHWLSLFLDCDPYIRNGAKS